jgi:hypothetical protein
LDTNADVLQTRAYTLETNASFCILMHSAK